MSSTKLKDTLGKPRDRPLFRVARDHRPRKAQAAYYAARFGVSSTRKPRSVRRWGSKEGFANVRKRSPRQATWCCVRPELSDPRVWIFDGRGGDPLGSLRADAAILRAVERRSSIRSKTAGDRGRYPSIRPPMCRPRFLPRSGGVCEEARDFHSVWSLAYAEVYFDNNPPPSVCGSRGAIERHVEFTSMSKTFRWPMAHGISRSARALIAA